MRLRDSIARASDDLTRPVDRKGVAPIAEVAQVGHDTIPPDERLPPQRSGDRARAHDLAAVIDPADPGRRPAERPEVGHHAVGPEHRVNVAVGAEARPGDLAVLVQVKSGGRGRAQVERGAAGPQDGAHLTARRAAPAGHLAVVVDVVRGAERATQRAQVLHDPVRDEKRVRLARRCLTLPDDLPVLVDILGGAGHSAEGPEVLCRVGQRGQDR